MAGANSTESSAPLKPPSPRQVAAVAAGNALEFYDFLTYAFFAPHIGRTFFPSADPTTSLLASLATFGAGFVARPVGALVIGAIGDRVGRKPAMLLSFALMGLAMSGIALTPGHASIGALGAVIVIVCRLVQGFALGGEVGPSTAFLIEAAPVRRRGFYVSFQYVGQDAAVLSAGVVGLALATWLTPAQLDAWGWRIAFLLGAVIVPFGLILRRGLEETLHRPEAPEVAATTSPIPLPMLVALGMMMLIGGTTVGYVLDYLSTYATETLHLPQQTGFMATILLGLTGVIFDPIGGLLSDRFGRKPVMLWPWLLLLVVTVPLFSLVSTSRSPAALFGMTVLLSVASAISGSSVLAALTEGFPKRIRSGALGLLYAVTISMFGGSTQFMVAWLTKLTHSAMAPAWYMTAGVAIALLAMLLVRETAPGPLERLARRREAIPPATPAVTPAV